MSIFLLFVIKKGIEDIKDGEVALYTMYNPKSVVIIRAYKNCFIQSMYIFKEQDEENYIIICLTVKSNTILKEVCHTVNQHAV